MQDEMTSRERVLAMLKRKPVDRVPVISGSAMVAEYIKKSGGIFPDYHHDSEMMVNAASLMHTDAGVDNIVMPFGMFVESIALGLEVKMGRIDIQPSVKGFFETPEEVNLDPDKFLADPYVRTTIEATEFAKERFPDAAITPFLVGPVTLTGYLMGVQNLANLSCKSLNHEEVMDEIIEWFSKALEINKIYARACIEAGADALYYSDASASPNLLIPDFYYQVGVPAEIELGEFIHKLGCPWELHICGDTTPIIEGMAATGANCLSVEQAVKMEEVVKIARNVPVVGNVTPLLMIDGTEEQIREETRRGLDGGAKASKLGCGTPSLSSPERLKQWVKAVTDWSAENL
ncbi:uroporphyrinogen decarboxylase family protein [Methanosarcina sp. Mfa9]|uniref:uroporphyrinogen decarboxylase family protein n=1 Tax=Methanosarcina sp. Mfa9 TaxID=3439063 RepID=UPI003F86E8BF